MWPAPQIAPLDPLTSYGYYDEVILPIRFSIDSNFSLESRFSALLSFLICEEICVPEDTNILIDFSRFSQAQLDDASSVLKYWMDKLPIEANFIIQTLPSHIIPLKFFGSLILHSIVLISIGTERFNQL